jgi:hypothetical protein
MTQSDAVISRTEAASIDDQTNYVPTVCIIGYVITVPQHVFDIYIRYWADMRLACYEARSPIVRTKHVPF